MQTHMQMLALIALSCVMMTWKANAFVLLISLCVETGFLVLRPCDVSYGINSTWLCDEHHRTDGSLWCTIATLWE